MKTSCIVLHSFFEEYFSSRVALDDELEIFRNGVKHFHNIQDYGIYYFLFIDALATGLWPRFSILDF